MVKKRTAHETLVAAFSSNGRKFDAIPGTSGTNRHAQSNLATASTEANEQQVRNIAARDQQNKTDCSEECCKTGAKISRHIFGQCPDCGRESAVDLRLILRAIALVERW